MRRQTVPFTVPHCTLMPPNTKQVCICYTDNETPASILGMFNVFISESTAGISKNLWNLAVWLNEQLTLVGELLFKVTEL